MSSASARKSSKKGTSSYITPHVDYQWTYSEVIVENGIRSEKTFRYARHRKSKQLLQPSICPEVSLASVEPENSELSDVVKAKNTMEEVNFSTPKHFYGHQYEKLDGKQKVENESPAVSPQNEKVDKKEESDNYYEKLKDGENQQEEEKQRIQSVTSEEEKTDADSDSTEKLKSADRQRIPNQRYYPNQQRPIYPHNYYHFCNCRCHGFPVSPYQHIVQPKEFHAATENTEKNVKENEKRSEEKAKKSTRKKKPRAKFFTDDKSENEKYDAKKVPSYVPYQSLNMSKDKRKR